MKEKMPVYRAKYSDGRITQVFPMGSMTEEEFMSQHRNEEIEKRSKILLQTVLNNEDAKNGTGTIYYMMNPAYGSFISEELISERRIKMKYIRPRLNRNV